MKMVSKRLLVVAVAAAVMPGVVYATNGMNLEGYGPIATGMGGASMAYDNGTAAVMNNPATLGLMGEGSRVDLAIGVLGPNITSSAMGTSWDSSANSFLMPAFGWAKKRDRLTYGFGAFAQGGMGTEYSPSPGGSMAAGMLQANQTAAVAFGNPATPPAATTIAAAAALKERSEVGVMRLILPLVYNVSNNVTVGGSIDYVRANMDLQMAMPGISMGQMIASGGISGTLVDGLNTAMTNGLVRDIYYGYFDFTDSSDFSGKATGDGFTGKLGATFRVNDKLSFGATYHAKTSLSDLSASGAKVTMALNGDTGYFTAGTPNNTFADLPATLTGTMKVVNFEWPTTYGIGFAYEPNSAWMVVGDVKVINWKDAMKEFKMSFTADNDPAVNGGFAGASMDAVMPQNWDDQTVIQLGAAYRATDKATVRFGYNRASNPIPNDTLHYLFPATIESHYTAGFGYAFSTASTVDFSVTVAPEVSATGTGAMNNGLKVTHSQTNWQLMYSYRF